MKCVRAALLMAAISLLSACQAEAPDSSPVSCEHVSRPDGLVIGGTGAGLALLSRLASEWRAAQPAGVSAITVLPSLGTSGGLQALRDGMIDVAILTRDLRDDERAGLVSTYLVSAPIVFTTRKPAPARNVTSAELIRWYTAPGARWPDRSRVTVLFRESGDGGLKVIKKDAPTLGEALDHDPRRSGMGVLLQTDQQMRDALLEVPGAVGWIDLGTLSLEQLPLEPLALDGVAPTPQALATGRYKLALSLWLVRRADAPSVVERLVAFAASPTMRAIWSANGYVLDRKER